MKKDQLSFCYMAGINCPARQKCSLVNYRLEKAEPQNELITKSYKHIETRRKHAPPRRNRDATVWRKTEADSCTFAVTKHAMSIYFQ